MNYEKAYNDALERAKKLVHDNAWVTTIFPEFTESEDERIRKEIVGFIEQVLKDENVLLLVADRIGDDIPNMIPGWIAYLEKQKEQKPVVYKDQESLLEKFNSQVYDCAWGKVTCKLEGETKEEYAKRWAIQLLSEVQDWADDYIDYECASRLRKSYEKEQKPAEWSEEDEKNKQAILQDLANIQAAFPKVNIQPEFDWLKSLRPQPHWKPSEEDLTALEYCAEHTCPELLSLYLELKKL